MRSRLIWAGLVILVAMGVVTAIARVLAIADVAAPVTRSRLDSARSMFPEIADEVVEVEQHFSRRPAVTVVHVTTGAVFLILGLLQFSASIRQRYLRFHRRSGYALVALALAAGTTGVWLGVVAPFSPTERVPSALAGAMFVIAPIVGVVAVRRGQVSRHREWMIRFFAVGIGIVVIRLVGPPIIWLLSPAPFRDIIGITFWAGWLLSAAVAEMWIRWTRSDHPMNASKALASSPA